MAHKRGRALKISVAISLFTGITITAFIAITWARTKEMSIDKAFKLGMGIVAFYSLLLAINFLIAFITSKEGDGPEN